MPSDGSGLFRFNVRVWERVAVEIKELERKQERIKASQNSSTSC